MCNNFHNNPIIYHAITDRFLAHNGKDIVPFSDGGSVSDIGTYHGGNYKGITKKILDGWFCSLGVNAILITAPYQQILGWIPGGQGEFRHYAYHGYFALDYTKIERRLGSESDLVELISSAHRKGIKVLFDVVMNHPGYADLWTLNALGIEILHEGWETAEPSNYYDYISYEDERIQQWWGTDWIRCSLPGYTPGGDDDLTMQLAGLPDFKTEATQFVAPPPLFYRKVDSGVEHIPSATVRHYLIHWLVDWVSKYGVDGFRCDSAKHVELDAWLQLKRAAIVALRGWKNRNPTNAIDSEDFWMTGEVFGQGIERSVYTDRGFDSLINFDFQNRLANHVRLEDLYHVYSDAISGRSTQILSYVSSHDTYLFDRARLIEAGTALLLTPGGIQILYGDETGRLPGPSTASDPAQATRSNMNWDSIDWRVLEHWRTIGKFRARHVSIARGEHTMIMSRPHVFRRFDSRSGDQVIVALGVTGQLDLDVSEWFADDEKVFDAYSGIAYLVKNGRVTVFAEDLVLLEGEPSDNLAGEA